MASVASLKIFCSWGDNPPEKAKITLFSYYEHMYNICIFQSRPESVGTPRSVGLVKLIIIIHSVLYFCLSNILLSKVNKNYNAVQSRLIRYLANNQVAAYVIQRTYYQFGPWGRGGPGDQQNHYYLLYVCNFVRFCLFTTRADNTNSVRKQKS